ncbi:MAG: hypothetical protein GKS00_11515 [Alphaproteobacteria bacterium]|nr:hypothetical protein [Alphaproteobacteria bacterium]
MSDTPTISIDEFKSRLHAAGFKPDDKSLKEMYDALPYLDAIRTQVRRAYAHSDEPAHVFSALELKS